MDIIRNNIHAPSRRFPLGIQIAYDGHGRWVKSEIVTDLGTTTTYFVSNYYEVTSDGRVTKYYFAGAQRVAMQQYKIPETPKVTYVLADHLGSTNVMVDEHGALVSELRYTAWGEVRYPANGQSPGPSEYTYTGQYSSMDDFGLMYYNARFYSPYINRFLSADTIVRGYANPQNLNRYSYVTNNPLRYTDPTGHWADEGCGTGGPGSPSQGTGCNLPTTSSGNGGSNNNNDHHHDEDEYGVPDYCLTHLYACGSETRTESSSTPTLDPTPAEEGDNEYFCITHPSSCDVTINPNAIVDPLAWTHIAEGILEGVVLFGVGDLLIGAGAYVCTTVIGCIAGAPVILAGVAAYPVGVGFIYFGVKSTEIYLDDIFEVTPSNRRR